MVILLTTGIAMVSYGNGKKVRVDQFYIQNFISGEHSFVFIMRKGVIDEFLYVLSKAGHQVLITSIGPFVTSHIFRQLNTYRQLVSFNGHAVDYNQEWTDFPYEAGVESSF